MRTQERGWGSERTHESGRTKEGQGIGKEVMGTRAMEQVGGVGGQARAAHCRERPGERARAWAACHSEGPGEAGETIEKRLTREGVRPEG